jgi:lipopolysaccharide biosynthesis glycosyltransferase
VRKVPLLYNVVPQELEDKCGIKPAEQKAIVLHFVGKQKPWFKNNPFNHEWKNNFERADQINLNNRLAARETWTRLTIYKYQFYLYFRYFFHLLFHWLHLFLGYIGAYLLKNHKHFYFKVKKIIIFKGD